MSAMGSETDRDEYRDRLGYAPKRVPERAIAVIHLSWRPPR